MAEVEHVEFMDGLESEVSTFYEPIKITRVGFFQTGTLYIDGKEHNINYTDIKRFLEKSCFCGIFSHFIEGNDRRKPKEVLRVLNVSSP